MSTITVTTANDTVDAGDGVTSLREAIGAASSGDLIVFQAALDGSTIGITAANGPLVIASGANLRIDGDIDHDGLADNITLSGLGAMSILTVESGATAAITGLRFQDGSTVGSALDVAYRGVTGSSGVRGRRRRFGNTAGRRGL